MGVVVFAVSVNGDLSELGSVDEFCGFPSDVVVVGSGSVVGDLGSGGGWFVVYVVVGADDVAWVYSGGFVFVDVGGCLAVIFAVDVVGGAVGWGLFYVADVVLRKRWGLTGCFVSFAAFVFELVESVFGAGAVGVAAAQAWSCDGVFFVKVVGGVGFAVSYGRLFGDFVGRVPVGDSVDG